jgi:hypothetical protein
MSGGRVGWRFGRRAGMQAGRSGGAVAWKEIASSRAAASSGGGRKLFGAGWRLSKALEAVEGFGDSTKLWRRSKGLEAVEC